MKLSRLHVPDVLISGTRLSPHCKESVSLTDDHNCLYTAQNLSISSKFPFTLSIKTINTFNTPHVFLHPYGTRDILLICLWRIGTSWLFYGITIVATIESHSEFTARRGHPRQRAWKLPRLSISLSKCIPLLLSLQDDSVTLFKMHLSLPAVFIHTFLYLQSDPFPFGSSPPPLSDTHSFWLCSVPGEERRLIRPCLVNNETMSCASAYHSRLSHQEQ